MRFLADESCDFETEPQEGVARLRLADGAGRHQDGGAVRLADHRAA